MSIRRFFKRYLSIALIGSIASVLLGSSNLSGASYQACAVGDINLLVFVLYSLVLIGLFYLVPMLTNSRWHNINNGKFTLRSK